ncbi:MAG: prenyltransferase/squalene oxidase repeat-containing protein [Thermogutta sp.]
MPNSIDLFFHYVTRSADLPVAFRTRHRYWVMQQQRSDGGFAGRIGDSNLYYTGFGARLCAVLWSEVKDPWLAIIRYLSTQLETINSVTDLASAATIFGLVRVLIDESLAQLVLEPLRGRAMEILANLRREDGGFAKAEHSAFGSTYATFLAINVMNLLDIAFDDREKLVQFICAQKRSDGGFAEVPHARHAGTNPTAAAVSVLADLDALHKIDKSDVAKYLRYMQRPDGGFAAGPFAPVSDLLSTCAALSTLWILGMQRAVSAPVESFVHSLEDTHGGFRGNVLDDQPDVEYTFYGLATLSLLRP